MRKDPNDYDLFRQRLRNYEQRQEMDRDPDPAIDRRFAAKPKPSLQRRRYPRWRRRASTWLHKG